MRNLWGLVVDGPRQTGGQNSGLLAGPTKSILGLFISKGVYTQTSRGFNNYSSTPINLIFNLLISLFYTQSTPPIRTTTYLI